MTALPSHKDEAFRYSDHQALAEVWDELAPPRAIHVTSDAPLAEVWMPSGEAIDVRRAILTVEAGATAEIWALNSASRYGRLEVEITLGEGADFKFHAANLGAGEANLEIVTVLRHPAPDATSFQEIRSVLGGKAIGSYLGRIEVAREGQRTDAEQSVKAMLLDRGATANAKPELEIFADDVACAHGATVGELDRDQLFYAAARGLPPEEAKALLLEGFVGGLWDDAPGDEIAALARRQLRALTK